MGSKPLGLKSIFSWALNILVGASRRPPIPNDEFNHSLLVCIL